MARQTSLTWILPLLSAVAIVWLVTVPENHRQDGFWDFANGSSVLILARTRSMIEVDDVRAAALVAHDPGAGARVAIQTDVDHLDPKYKQVIVLGSATGQPRTHHSPGASQASITRWTDEQDRTWTAVDSSSPAARLQAITCLVDVKCAADLREKAENQRRWEALLRLPEGRVVSFRPGA